MCVCARNDATASSIIILCMCVLIHVIFISSSHLIGSILSEMKKKMFPHIKQVKNWSNVRENNKRDYYCFLCLVFKKKTKEKKAFIFFSSFKKNICVVFTFAWLD
jgi:hypothetical protein